MTIQDIAESLPQSTIKQYGLLTYEDRCTYVLNNISTYKASTAVVDVDFIQSIKTKRFLYDVLKTNVINQSGCFGVMGSRHVGKTILLQQLFCDNMETAIYLDCSFLKNNTKFNFSHFYSTVYQDGKHIILLDEVCKINSDTYLEFISSTKLYSAKLCIIITGSVQLLVDNICNEICRGQTFTLPPFLYIEKLCWLHEINSVQLQAIKQYINKETFFEYLKNQFMLNTQLLAYTKGVVQDTIESYRNNTILEGDISVDDKTLNNALKYISLCQVVYRRSSDNNFNAIPNIEPELRELIFNGEYETARNKCHLRKHDIEKVISLLACSNLIHRFSNMIAFNNMEDAYVFEYPWYASYCLSPSVQSSKILLDIWVEYSILLRVSYVYSDVAKYRDVSGNEIDIVYKINNWYGLEIKNRPKSNISDSYNKKLSKLSHDLSLSELLISDEDLNPILVTMMEFEYIQIVSKGDYETSKSIQTLLSEFKHL